MIETQEVILILVVLHAPRLGLHDGEHVGPLCRPEGPAVDTPAEGE